MVVEMGEPYRRTKEVSFTMTICVLGLSSPIYQFGWAARSRKTDGGSRSLRFQSEGRLPRAHTHRHNHTLAQTRARASARADPVLFAHREKGGYLAHTHTHTHTHTHNTSTNSTLC